MGFRVFAFLGPGVQQLLLTCVDAFLLRIASLNLATTRGPRVVVESDFSFENLETATTLVFWELVASEDMFPRVALVNSRVFRRGLLT